MSMICIILIAPSDRSKETFKNSYKWKKGLSVLQTQICKTLFIQKNTWDTHLLKDFMTHFFTVKMNWELPWVYYFIWEQASQRRAVSTARNKLEEQEHPTEKHWTSTAFVFATVNLIVTRTYHSGTSFSTSQTVNTEASSTIIFRQYEWLSS